MVSSECWVKVGIPLVVECGGELLGQADLLVELTKHQESGITGERSGGELELDRPRGEEIEGESWGQTANSWKTSAWCAT